MLFILLIILIFLSAFFAAIETAFFSLSEVDLRRLTASKKQKSAAIIVKFKSEPQTFLSIVSIGSNLVNISASALATILAINYFGSNGASIAIGVMTLLVLVFGEITPKSVAIVYDKQIVLASADIILFLSYIFWPLIRVFDLIHQTVNRVLNSSATSVDFEENVKIMAKIGVEKGKVNKREHELIKRIFEFNDIAAEDVMTSRSKIVAWKATDKISDALDYVIESAFSRIPIYDDKLDNITGIVYIKDILKAVADNNTGLSLQDIARQAYFVPLTKIIDDLLKDFQKKRLHMAIVVDEYGVVQGLVTLEDLLEELVGEIIDETDVEEHLIKRVDKRTIIVDGNVEVEDVNRFFNVDLSAAKSDTISWLILDQLKEIPKKGQAVIFGSVKLIVEEADEKRIKKVKIIK